MSKFEIGDKVRMPGIPVPPVEVLELAPCEEGACGLGDEIFRFKDPGGLGDDWMHTSEFEKV